MEYNDPESKQSTLLLGEQATQFYFSASTHLLHPVESCQGSPTCPNRTWLQIRFCPHPVLRKDRVKQLTSHGNEHRCKGDKQAESLNISTPPPPSRGRGGRPQPTTASSQVQGHLLSALVSFLFLLHAPWQVCVSVFRASNPS